MARVLLTTFGSLGDLRPFVAVGRALVRRGHDAVVATHPDHRAEVERAGVGFRPVRPAVEDLGGAGVLRLAMHPRRGTEHVVRRLVLPHVRRSHDDLLAAAADRDAVVGHVLTLAAAIVAARRGIPYLRAELQPLTFLSVHDPPVLPGVPGGALAPRLPPWAARWLYAAGRRVARPWLSEVAALRTAAGMRPHAHPGPFEERSDVLNLALFSPLLAAPRPDWPPRTVVCGFPAYAGMDGDLPDGLRAFLDAGPEPVVFTLGSSAVWDPGTFFADAARAARALGVRAVLLAGPGAPAGADEGVCTVPWAPHALLFPRGRAVVHQGGIGTTGEALRAGRPMLVVPFSHDQPDNAARCARLGVARVLGRGAGASRLERSLAAVLRDEGMRARAAEVGARVRTEDGGGTAAAAIERALEEA